MLFKVQKIRCGDFEIRFARKRKWVQIKLQSVTETNKKNNGSPLVGVSQIWIIDKCHCFYTFYGSSLSSII